MGRKEAIEVIKKNCPASSFTMLREALETLIPELAESEDEKMRRWIINYLDNKALNSGIIQEKTNIKNAIAWLEKQGEQKPVEWSMFDETILKNLIEHFEYKKEFNEAEDYDILLWLKSLKDRVQPQPKQEWTMQDEEELQIALDTLVKAGQHSSAKWLKNVCLVPQSHWKPSEEQMLAINTAINVLGKGTLNGKQLVELQEQLKKL